MENFDLFTIVSIDECCEIPDKLLYDYLSLCLSKTIKLIELFETNEIDEAKSLAQKLSLDLVSIMKSCGNTGARTTIQKPIKLDPPYIMFRPVVESLTLALSSVPKMRRDVGMCVEIAVVYIYYIYKFITCNNIVSDIQKSKTS